MGQSEKHIMLCNKMQTKEEESAYIHQLYLNDQPEGLTLVIQGRVIGEGTNKSSLIDLLSVSVRCF